jgi:hypothetical protein
MSNIDSPTLTSTSTSAFFSESSEEVMKRISQATSAEELINQICYSDGNVLFMDYRYFKYIASVSSYHLITTRVVEMIDQILLGYPKFDARVCIKFLTVTDVDKHMTYVKSLSNVLKTRYQDKMETCSIYNAPFIFAQIYGIVSCFIDKDTQAKIVLVKKQDNR